MFYVAKYISAENRNSVSQGRQVPPVSSTSSAVRLDRFADLNAFANCFGERRIAGLDRDRVQVLRSVEIRSAIVSHSENLYEAPLTLLHSYFFPFRESRRAAGRPSYLRPRKINEPRGVSQRRPSSKRRLKMKLFSVVSVA